jgi:glycosyltransferase involved in cell wall biosynthesis
MRILTLIHEYPPIGGGGGRVAQDLCRGLVQRGHEVLVLTPHFGDLAKEENDEGVQVRRLPSLRSQAFRAGLRAMGGFVAASFLYGLRAARTWKPDVIHAHFAVPAGAAAGAVSALSGIPYVLTAHLGDVPGGVPSKTGKWFRVVYPFTPPIWKRAAQIAAVSEFTRGLALQHYPVNIQVIPNGVDLTLIQPTSMEPHIPPRIVFAARFVPQKNPLQIVRSLTAVKDLPWQCTLIGDGALRGDVIEEIERQGLRERFDLPGWLNPAQVLEWFDRSDILFMPSLSEGLPVTGVQALAMGLAVVASRIGGFMEVVEPGVNGELIDPDDPAGYERALRKLLVDPACLRQTRQASRRLAERFDLVNIVQKYEALLQKAAG